MHEMTAAAQSFSCVIEIFAESSKPAGQISSQPWPTSNRVVSTDRGLATLGAGPKVMLLLHPSLLNIDTAEHALQRTQHLSVSTKFNIGKKNSADE